MAVLFSTGRRVGGDFPPMLADRLEDTLVTQFTLTDFVRESNRIEGIHRNPTPAEIGAHERMIGLRRITVADMTEFVAIVQPDARLRNQPGLDVRVGSHYPPRGGPEIEATLHSLLSRMRMPSSYNPYTVHHAYETLHPYTDGNGRSGRALWLHMMGGRAPLGFLHSWYYQSLQHGRAG